MANRKKRTDRIAVACINALSLLLLLLLFFALVYAAQPRDHFRSGASLSYTLCCRAVRAEYVTDVHVGDTVLDAVGKRVIGHVKEYAVTPAVTEVYNRKSGSLCKRELPDRVTLTLTVKTEAVREGDGYTVSGFHLIGGKSIPLRLPNFVGTGVCTQITEDPH